MAQQDRNDRSQRNEAEDSGPGGGRSRRGRYQRGARPMASRMGPRRAGMYGRAAEFQLVRELATRRSQLRAMAYLRAYQAQLEDAQRYVRQALDSLSEVTGGIPPQAYDTRAVYSQSRREQHAGGGAAHDDDGDGDGGADNGDGDDDDDDDDDGDDDDGDNDNGDAGGDNDDGDDYDGDDDPTGPRPSGRDTSDEGDFGEDVARSGSRDRSGSGSDTPGRAQTWTPRRPPRAPRGAPSARLEAIVNTLDGLVRVRDGRPLAPRLGVVNRELAKTPHRQTDLDELNRAFAVWRRRERRAADPAG